MNPIASFVPPSKYHTPHASVILIPYRELETDASEVYLFPVSNPHALPIDQARTALADFAQESPDDADAIIRHCENWSASRILLPRTHGTWVAYRIPSVFTPALEEAK